MICAPDCLFWGLGLKNTLVHMQSKISGKMAGAPRAQKGAVGGSESTKEPGLSDEDIEKQLEMLKM